MTEIKKALKTIATLIVIFFAIGGFINFLETLEHQDPQAMRIYAVSKSHEAYRMIPSTPLINKRVRISNLTIEVVGGKQYFRHKSARNWDGKINGYAATYRYKGKRKHYIGLIGKEINGKILLNFDDLGHEVAHILNDVRPDDFYNPDTLKEEGL